MIARSKLKRMERTYAVDGDAYTRACAARRRSARWRRLWRERWYEENARCGTCSRSEGACAGDREGEPAHLADVVHCIPNDCLCLSDGEPCGEWEWAS